MKIGDTYEYNSTKDGVDSFTFTIFGINNNTLDILVNKEIYAKIKKSELKANNVRKIDRQSHSNKYRDIYSN